MVERYREEEYRSRDMQAAAARAKKRRDELAAKKAASDRRIREANLRYQRTQTPLGEKVREIERERVGETPVSAVYPDRPTFQKAGVVGKRVRRRRPKAETKDITETYEVGREELVKEGYRPEDIDTPFMDLGGTAETGYKPPYVLAQMEEDAGIPEEQRSPATEPYRAIVSRRRAYPWAGAIAFGALISFALRVRDG